MLWKSLTSFFVVYLLLSPQHAFSDIQFLKFPRGFKWGAATAGHQIEGGDTTSDWFDFENKPGFKSGAKAGTACDHWNRVDQDIELMKDIRIQAYRFSVEWSKIQPREPQVDGKTGEVTDYGWDLDAVLHYRREVQALLKNGIEPIITLHHFTLPRWVRAHGGWEWPGAPAAFERFTQLVVSDIGPEVRTWITFNEPMNYLAGGYIAGLTPPGRTTGAQSLISPLVGILKSHILAFQAIKAAARKSTPPVTMRVGMVHQLRILESNSLFNPLDKVLANYLNPVFNWSILEATENGTLDVNVPFFVSASITIVGLKGTQDFLGLNYYTRDLIHFSFSDAPNYVKFSANPEGDHSDPPMGWEIYPQGFYQVLKEVNRRIPGKPILITENGIADAADRVRPNFLKDHLQAIHQAITEGVKIEGYLHWSLMDNFEWQDGYTPRFGLYAVDYNTQIRTPRPSAFLFSEIISVNGFWADSNKKYTLE